MQEKEKGNSQRSEVGQRLDVMVRLLRDDRRLRVIPAMNDAVAYMPDLFAVNAYVFFEAS